MQASEIRKHEVWSIENMERHTGVWMPAKPVAVEFLKSGRKKYAFVYYRTEDGRYWYKRVTETEGIRIESGLADREAHAGSGYQMDAGAGTEMHSEVYAGGAKRAQEQ